MFSETTELFPTDVYGGMCWKSLIFEVIWNLFYVMIVSGRLPNCGRKRADAAKDHPGEENKIKWLQERMELGQVTPVGSQPCRGVQSLSPGSRNGARVGRAPRPTTPSLQGAGAVGTVLAGHEGSPDTALASLSLSWWQRREGWPGQKATLFLPSPVNLISCFSVLEGFVMCLYGGRRLHLK